MPPTAMTAVLNVIPRPVLTFLKSLYNKPNIYYDWAFAISTKFIPTCIVVTLCIGVSNEWYNYRDIVCQSSQGPDWDEDTLDQYCWTHGTFLVAKYLSPEWEGKVPHPGVGSFEPGKDEIILQAYYNHTWLILVIIAFANYLPHYIWKAIGNKKLECLLENDISGVDRAGRLVDSLGMNRSFGFKFGLLKIFSSLTLIGSAVYLDFMIPGYYSYGWSQLVASRSTWPSPRDQHFPKSAKCNKLHYGESGDIQTISGICSLPLNVLSQWTFLCLWWLLLIACILNFATTANLAGYATGSRRNRTFKVLCLNIFRDLEDNDIIVDIVFGDWILFKFIRQNLSDRLFAELLIALVTEYHQGIIRLHSRPAKSVDQSEDEGPHHERSAEPTGSHSADTFLFCAAKTCAAIE